MKVYMPTKPIKYGFKVYMMIDASNSCVLSWMMHTEKSEILPLVEQITEGFENRGFRICMDRYYTAINVVKTLSERGLGVYGAIKEMRARGTPFLKKS